MALFGAKEKERRAPAPTSHQPRPLPSLLPLLPVKDVAA
jgi:hypothetical protein